MSLLIFSHFYPVVWKARPVHMHVSACESPPSSHRNSCTATVINSKKQLMPADSTTHMQIVQMNANVS